MLLTKSAACEKYHKNQTKHTSMHQQVKTRTQHTKGGDTYLQCSKGRLLGGSHPKIYNFLGELQEVERAKRSHGRKERRLGGKGEPEQSKKKGEKWRKVQFLYKRGNLPV